MLVSDSLGAFLTLRISYQSTC